MNERLQTLIEEYASLRDQIEALEVHRKAVAKEIEAEMSGEKSVKVNGFTASLVSSFSRSLDWKAFQTLFSDVYERLIADQLLKISEFSYLRVSKRK